jgi:hypothetical protein
MSHIGLAVLLALALLTPALQAPQAHDRSTTFDDCHTIWPTEFEAYTECADGGSHGTKFNVADGTVEELRKENGRWHVKKKQKPSDFPLDAHPINTPISHDEIVADIPEATTFADPVVMDVAIFWTDQAQAGAGGSANMRAHAVNMAAVTNQAYASSLINARVNLVIAELVSGYVESSSNDLNRLQRLGDGYLDIVHTRREQVGADQVTLIGNTYAGAGFCGVAYYMSSPSSAFASNAFTVVDRGCATGNLSYPHELGHNQGMQHDPQTVCGQAVCSTTLYNYGHRFGIGRTVLAYPDGSPRLPYFSNPNVLYNGNPTGIANQRDNARRLNDTAAIVAAFKSPPSTRIISKPTRDRIVL